MSLNSDKKKTKKKKGRCWESWYLLWPLAPKMAARDQVLGDGGLPPEMCVQQQQQKKRSRVLLLWQPRGRRRRDVQSHDRGVTSKRSSRSKKDWALGNRKKKTDNKKKDSSRPYPKKGRRSDSQEWRPVEASPRKKEKRVERGSWAQPMQATNKSNWRRTGWPTKRTITEEHALSLIHIWRCRRRG